MNGYVFSCRDVPYEPYCSVSMWDDSLLDADPDAMEHWGDSWNLESACGRTETPTEAPTPMPYCPPPYDEGADYRAGDEVEVDGTVYACRDGPHEPYCGVAEWDDALLEGDADAREHWTGAWRPGAECYRTEAPTGGPTAVPSLAGSDRPSLADSGAPSSAPSLAESDRPSLSPSARPSLGPSERPSHSPSLDPSSAPSEHPR